MAYIITSTASGNIAYPAGVPLGSLGIDPMTVPFSNVNINTAFGLTDNEIGEQQEIIDLVTAGHITVEINGLFLDASNIAEFPGLTHVHQNMDVLDRIVKDTHSVAIGAIDETVTVIEEADNPTGIMLINIENSVTTEACTYKLDMTLSNGVLRYSATVAGAKLNVSVNVNKQGTAFEFDVTNDEAAIVYVTTKYIII